MEPNVVVSESSQLARYAQWHATGKGLPIGAFGASPTEASYFVADEMLVDRQDQDAIDELVRDHGAEVIPERPLPPPPEQLRRRRRIELNPDTMPGAVRLHFAQPPRVGIAELAEALAIHTDAQGEISVSSEAAARLAALAARFADRPTVGLNMVGTTTSMPMSTVTEASGPFPADPTGWASVAGLTRMKQAWQLVDSVRQIRGDDFVMLGVLDGGFWLDDKGVPRGPDFGSNVMQMNLMDPLSIAGNGYSFQFAGGPNPNKCTGGSTCTWHGNGVAGIAAATVNNMAGSAGAAGNTAHPFLFLTNITAQQVMQCANICASWGIDVLNMSFEFSFWPGFAFGSSTWESTFQAAADAGVIMVASAGNDGTNLPEKAIPRPATRTPGVLTIGALNTDGTAAETSNYGTSVNLWAPGVDIPAPPDGDKSQGSLQAGTSAAAPIVSGVAAMMRYVNPGLSAAEARQILIETGWPGQHRVTRGLDAYAAVFRAMRGTMLDTAEPNNTPQSAQLLTPVAGGNLRPAVKRYSAISSVQDRDYWKFTLDRFSTVTVTVDWYKLIAALTVEVETDHRNDMALTHSLDRVTLTGVLAPGEHRILVSGAKGITAYALNVQTAPADLGKDRFEDNDSFDTAALLLFRKPDNTEAEPPRPYWGPGTYDTTLHLSRKFTKTGPAVAVNDDYFLLAAAPALIQTEPTITIDRVDFPLTVTLYDAAREVLKIHALVHNRTIRLEPGKAHYLKITAQQPTRYRLTTAMATHKNLKPGPLQEAVVPLIPDWWLDKQTYRVDETVKHYAVEVTQDRGGLAFGGSIEAVRAELLSGDGTVLNEGAIHNGRLAFDTASLADGLYFVRLTRLEPIDVALHQLPPQNL